MYQKRYLVGKIERHYPAGMLSDVDVVTDSKHKAMEYILQKFMIVQLINDFGDKYGLGVEEFQADYQISDLHTGMVYEFEYFDSSSCLNKMTEKYSEHEEFREFCVKLEKDCIELLKEEKEVEDYWSELFIESYIDLSLNISFDESDIEAFFKEHGVALQPRILKVL